MTAGAPRLHSPDSRISWRVNPFGIASVAATVSELSCEIRMGLDQFIVCHLGSGDHSRQQLSLCASWIKCKHAMGCHQPGFTVQRLISRQVVCCVELQHPINEGQEPLNGWCLSVGNVQSIKYRFFTWALINNFIYTQKCRIECAMGWNLNILIEIKI